MIKTIDFFIQSASNGNIDGYFYHEGKSIILFNLHQTEILKEILKNQYLITKKLHHSTTNMLKIILGLFIDTVVEMM